MLITGKPHISFSELATWDECSWRHKLRYIDKVEFLDTEGPELYFGKHMHALCEKYISTKVIDIDSCMQLIRESWTEKKFSDVDGYLLSAVKIADELPTFMDLTFPGWNAVGVEIELYENITEHDASFKGFIDCVISVEKKSKKKIYWIIDWKTTSYGWYAAKKRDPRKQLQLILYKQHWAEKRGIDPKDIRCGFVLLKRTAKPGKRCELVKVSVGLKAALNGKKKVNNMLTSMKRGMFMKNRDSCRYCPYKNTEHCT